MGDSGVIWGSADGRQRVRREVCISPPPPENKGAPYTVLLVQGYGGFSVVDEFNAQHADNAGHRLSAEHVRDLYEDFSQQVPVRIDPWEVVRRYYRAFLGIETHVSHHLRHAQGGAWVLVSFDTPEWRQATGVPDSLSIEDAEFTAAASWARGDVCNLVHEVRESTCGNPDHDEWVDEDVLFPFYGESDHDLIELAKEHFNLEEVA